MPATVEIGLRDTPNDFDILVRWKRGRCLAGVAGFEPAAYGFWRPLLYQPELHPCAVTAIRLYGPDPYRVNNNGQPALALAVALYIPEGGKQTLQTFRPARE